MLALTREAVLQLIYGMTQKGLPYVVGLGIPPDRLITVH